MADFAPPSGPPPPKVPEGWKAIWNDQYKEWFYANIYTKQTQWDKPTSPVYPPGGEAPPGYNEQSSKPVGPEKGGLGEAGMSEDERLARQLQEEENAKAAHGVGPAGSRTGAADGYYNDAYAQPPQGQLAPGYGSPGPSTSPKRKSLLGKFFGGNKHHGQQQGYYPPGQPGYGYPPPAGYMQQGGRRPGGGLGMGGAAAMGAGGGLLGGMMLGNALDGHHGGYGGDDGGDDGGGDYGGDGGYGGGDDGGGGFGGGDFGGGDFGGGDGGGGD